MAVEIVYWLVMVKRYDILTGYGQERYILSNIARPVQYSLDIGDRDGVLTGHGQDMWYCA